MYCLLLVAALSAAPLVVVSSMLWELGVSSLGCFEARSRWPRLRMREVELPWLTDFESFCSSAKRKVIYKRLLRWKRVPRAKKEERVALFYAF